MGEKRVENVKKALERMDGFVGEVEGYVAFETAYVEDAAAKESVARLEQLEASSSGG